MTTKLTTSILNKLREELKPEHIEVMNESHMHGTPSDDSHFKVVAVSSAFESQRLLQRHRLVNKILADELAGPVHALSLHLYTPAEWEQSAVPESPACRGGSKHESG